MCEIVCVELMFTLEPQFPLQTMVQTPPDRYPTNCNVQIGAGATLMLVIDQHCRVRLRARRVDERSTFHALD